MTEKSFDTITDFITGKDVPNIGAEENRQAVEKFLVNEKGFLKQDIEVNAAIEITIAGESYKSAADLVVSVDGKRFMTIKCAAGSLGSREREILAASRLLNVTQASCLQNDAYQIPYAIVSDGKTAIILNTVSGKKIGEGLNAIPSKDEAKELLKTLVLEPLSKERLEKEKIIFRSYDSMNINRA